MRKFFLIVLFVSIQVFFYAQNSKKKNKAITANTDEFNLTNYKGEPGDRLIIEINHTSWMGKPAEIKTNWRSVGFNFAFMFDKPIGRSSFSFGYGLGIYGHNYHSNANFLYVNDSISHSQITKLKPLKSDYKTNSYSEKILEIPLELRYRSKTDRKFKVALGIKGGYVINDFRKLENNDEKIKVYNTKNINRLRYGVNFRIGVEQFCFTACYYISEVFTKDKGVNGVNMFSIGFALIPY